MSDNYSNWKNDNSISSELLNNLLLVDNIVCTKKLDIIPEFHILGGAALIFNGINYKSTLDIDVANKIDKSIRDEVELFISDNASEVAILASNYVSRLITFNKTMFNTIKVFILSNEDILISKLGSDRNKDFNQINKTNILSNIDVKLVYSIINNEISNPITKMKIENRLNSII